MWHEIDSGSDVSDFMREICRFHDGCIKEMKYLSGAYVDEGLSMYPFNDRRILRVVIQRQFEENSMIEMEFEGLKHLGLSPCDEEKYTCEISAGALALKNGCVYWCDGDKIPETDFDNYDGTLICASKLRWRSIDNCMGEKEFYISREAVTPGIDEIMNMLDWNNTPDVQQRGRAWAKGIKCINVFLQPCQPEYNKNVWDNCAAILAERTDAELEPYLRGLFEWLTDINWPGAYCISERLKKYKDRERFNHVLGDCIKSARASNDEQWLCNLLDIQKINF